MATEVFNQDARQGVLYTDHDGRSDMFSFVDHISRFSGLAVAQLYLLAALVTVYEVFMRYFLFRPTTWAFEVVMVACAAAWVLSAGYLTLKKRHMAITVISDIAGPEARWWLELVGYLVGALALLLLIDDAAVRAIQSILAMERTGTSFNSPQPMLTKTVLAAGAFLFLVQLLVNLYRHFDNPVAKGAVLSVMAFMLVWIAVTVFIAFGADLSILITVQDGIGAFGNLFNPKEYIDARSYDLGTICIVMVGALILLMLTGMPLGIVTLIVPIIAAITFFGPRGVFLVSSNGFGLLNQYSLVAVPMFVLMASILERAGVARDLFDAMSIFAGNLRGGVAVQTVAVAVILAAMSGVMGGEIIMLGLVALPQMLRLGYDTKIAVGVIVAAGSLATLIPPSIIIIVYGLSASVPVSELFLAGAVPGLMLASFYALYVFIRCNLDHSLAPTAAEIAQMSDEETRLGTSQKIAVLLCILLIFSVMGTIYLGIASVTEAAGVGVIGAMTVAAARNKFNLTMLLQSLASTMNTVGTIIWVIIGAVAFVGIFNLIGGTEYVRDIFANIGLPALGIIFMMMLVLIILGTFMEWIAIVFLTVPVFAPVIGDLAPALGLTQDEAKIWFGILFVMNMQIYFLSPPLGPACFWLKSVAPPQVTLQTIYIAVLPFIGLQIVGLLLVMFIPEIALFLPKLLSN